MRRALGLAVVILLTPACGGKETEQAADGPDACVADLTKVIGPKPELRGAAWSPDGLRIAFSAWNGRRSRIYSVSVANCAVARLGPRGNLGVGAPDWSSTNVIAFDGTTPGGSEGIYTMTVGGREVRRVTDGPDLFPEWSPDGSRIAFARGGYAEATDDDPSPAYANRNIWVVSSNGSGLRRVTNGRWHGSAGWSPDGERLVTDTGSAVDELGVDGSHRRVSSRGSTPIRAGHRTATSFSCPQESGAGLVLAEGGHPPVEPLGTPIACSPERSPDGEWIAFTDGEKEADVWIVRRNGTGLRQLTTVR